MAIHGEDGPSQKEKRKRRSSLRAMVLLLLAGVAAIGAALLLTRYMDARVAAARIPTTRVVVATVEIPVATPLKAEWLSTVSWPSVARPDGSFENVTALVGKVARVPVSRGEAVLASKLATAGDRGGLATLLPKDMRAAAVRVDDVVGVAGFLHPGDSVDVISTMKPREDGPFTSKIVLQDVKVLAVGKDLEFQGKEADKAQPATVATLMVTVEESERLALAALKGQLLLTLRGVGDEDEFATTGAVPLTLFAMNAPEPPRPAPVKVVERPRRRERPKRPAPVAATPPPAAHPKQVVEILRGDLFEKRDFDAQEKRP